jgi:symplekin
LIQAPASQQTFLTKLLDLCVCEGEEIHSKATEVVLANFYRTGSGASTVDSFAVSGLVDAIHNPNDMNCQAKLIFFFAIMEENTKMFLVLMSEYGSAPKTLRSEMHKRLKGCKSIWMTFDRNILSKALELAKPEADNVVLIHRYLRQLAETLTEHPPEFVELLKKQFQKHHDARYLVPIMRSLTVDEFVQFLPDLLRLQSDALRLAIINLLSGKSQSKEKVSRGRFLIELHKIDAASPVFEKAIEAVNICFKQTDVFTYETSISAVEAVCRNYAMDLVVYTLLVMIDLYKESHKYILTNLVQQLIGREIYRLEKPWELLQDLLYKTKPASFKIAVTLPLDRVVDYVTRYPDIKAMMRNQATLGVRTAAKDQIVKALTEKVEEEKEEKPE